MEKTYHIYAETYKRDGQHYRHYRHPYMMMEILGGRKDWVDVGPDKMATYSDLSEFSTIHQYLDGTPNLWIKAMLSRFLQKSNYFPYTIIIDSRRLRDSFNRIKSSIGKKVWFLKRSAEYSGGGSDVFPLSGKKLKESVIHTISFREGIDEESFFDNPEKKEFIYVLQIGIDPLLRFGKKFDFRIYNLIVYDYPDLRLYRYDNGFIRIAPEKYDPSSLDITKQLTNTSRSTLVSDESVTLTELIDESHELYEYMPEFDRILVDVFKRIAHTFKVKKNGKGFMLLGVDYILDKNKKMYLIEINRRPALYNRDNPKRSWLHFGIEDTLMPDMVDLTLESIALGYEYKKPENKFIRIMDIKYNDD